ncbi:MAG TPA: 3-isopropylmalate dehydrogenase, partial [Oscillospiraceae bacterium]|nr:3-isopropylmalate dehydrogenase [Oscillospiraceae bacterium]
PAGGGAYDQYGTPLPPESLDACRAADAVLLGAVGGPRWDAVPRDLRPERALLRIRAELGLFANLRPSRLFPVLAAASPLRADIAAAGVDLLVVRELTGGIYFGAHGTETESGLRRAHDEMAYGEREVERIARAAFTAARGRRKKVTSVDKANVLDVSRLWREVVEAVARDYPDVSLGHMYVDNAAMQLVRAPGQFDVILTGNMFGDILSDEASAVVGSIGVAASASLGGKALPAGGVQGMYEPIHGTAPDIAGKDVANPVGAILSAAMLLRHSLLLEKEAVAVERAVAEVLASGLRTADIAAPGEKPVGCRALGWAVASRVRAE